MDSLFDRQKKMNDEARLTLLGVEANQTFETYVPQNEHARKIKEYLVKKPDKFYLFHGANGTGKTHLAYALANKYLDEYIKENQLLNAFFEQVVGITSIDLSLQFQKSKRFESEDGCEIDVQRYYRSIEFLIIDEIGRTNKSEYFNDILFSIIDYRLKYGKHTILISNLSEASVKAELGAGLSDRVFNLFTVCEFDWGSYRPNQKI